MTLSACIDAFNLSTFSRTGVPSLNLEDVIVGTDSTVAFSTVLRLTSGNSRFGVEGAVTGACLLLISLIGFLKPLLEMLEFPLPIREFGFVFSFQPVGPTNRAQELVSAFSQHRRWPPLK